MFKASTAPTPCSSSLGRQALPAGAPGMALARTPATFEQLTPCALLSAGLLAALDSAVYSFLPQTSSSLWLCARARYFLPFCCLSSLRLPLEPSPHKCVCSSGPVLSLPYTHPESVIHHLFTDEPQMCTDLPSCFT